MLESQQLTLVSKGLTPPMEVDDCLTLLAQGDGQSNAFALDCLVEQLGNRKTDECVLQLLSHSRWREVLKTLFKELRSLNLRLVQPLNSSSTP